MILYPTLLDNSSKDNGRNVIQRYYYPVIDSNEEPLNEEEIQRQQQLDKDAADFKKMLAELLKTEWTKNSKRSSNYTTSLVASESAPVGSQRKVKTGRNFQTQGW